ncbi:hypothetical protein JCM11491_006389 [Sporobolomyces phaffii]
MTRFILFNGAPTVTQCVASQRRSLDPLRWDTTVVDWSQSCLNISAAPTRPASDSGRSQFEDAPEHEPAPESEPDPTRDVAKRRKTSHARPQHASVLLDGDGENSMCQSFFMFPPPSQPRPTAVRPLDVGDATTTSHNDSTFLRHDLASILLASPPHASVGRPPPSPSERSDASAASSSSSLELSIGAPPALPWAIYDLTKLDQLRTRLAHAGAGGDSDSAVVSVLGVVVSVDVKETSRARLAEVVLGDETGGHGKVIAWGQEGDELNAALRVGDVVYFGIKLIKSKFSGALELRLIERTSRVGIAFRTRVFDALADGVYRFDRAWGRELEQARAVLDIVDWWTNHRELARAATRSNARNILRLVFHPRARPTLTRPLLLLPLAPMPPRRAAAAAASTSSSSKRKPPRPSPSASPRRESDLSEPESELASPRPPPKKKAKKAPAAKKGPVTPIHPDLAHNVAFPDPLGPFPRPTEPGTVRIASWNVAGLKACEKKGFSKYVEAEDADILCLNETKCDSLALPSLDDRYPYRYWGVHHKKGQAGVAVFSKLAPVAVVKGLPTTEPDAPQRESEGRIITLEFDHTYLVATYVPNAGQGLKTLPEKEAWNRAFETYLHDLDRRKPVVWIGDVNVVPTELDIRNWKTNHNKSAGVTDSEIGAFHRQLAGPPAGNSDEDGAKEDKGRKFVDVWRERNAGVVGHYTYFSYKFQCRVKGIGWRIDLAVCSERVMDKVSECEIRQTIYGASDHVPITLDFQGPL